MIQRHRARSSCSLEQLSVHLDESVFNDFNLHQFSRKEVSETIDDVQSRLRWDVDTECYVFSRSTKTWCDGTIVEVTINEETNEEWLTVQYGDQKRKKIQRFSSFIRSKDVSSDYTLNPHLFQWIIDRLKSIQNTPNIKQSESSETEKLTKLIVCGYLREYEWNMIPNDLIHFITSLVNDMFQNDGVYQWVIEDEQTVDTMLTAKCGQMFRSDPFEMAQLQWQLEVYPNGDSQDTKGYLVIHLRLISMPSMIESVEFCRIFRVKENMSSSSWVVALSVDEFEFWGRKCALNELKEIHPNSLTISVEIQINKLVFKQDADPDLKRSEMEMDGYHAMNKMIDSVLSYDQYGDGDGKVLAFEYVMSGKELDSLRTAQVHKEMCSEMMDGHYGMWTLGCLVNEGDDNVDDLWIGVYLTVCKFPPNCVAVTAEYELGCKETGKTEFCTNTFSMPDELGFGTSSSLAEWDEIADLETLTWVCTMKSVRMIMEESTDDDSVSITDPLVISRILGR